METRRCRWDEVFFSVTIFSAGLVGLFHLPVSSPEVIEPFKAIPFKVWACNFCSLSRNGKQSFFLLNLLFPAANDPASDECGLPIICIFLLFLFLIICKVVYGTIKYVFFWCTSWETQITTILSVSSSGEWSTSIECLRWVIISSFRKRCESDIFCTKHRLIIKEMAQHCVVLLDRSPEPDFSVYEF